MPTLPSLGHGQESVHVHRGRPFFIIHIHFSVFQPSQQVGDFFGKELGGHQIRGRGHEHTRQVLRSAVDMSSFPIQVLLIVVVRREGQHLHVSLSRLLRLEFVERELSQDSAFCRPVATDRDIHAHRFQFAVLQDLNPNSRLQWQRISRGQGGEYLLTALRAVSKT